MQVVDSRDGLRGSRGSAPPPVGLVPTMGYLHDGHLSLITRARKECHTVVVSIFVNPTQFGPHEDFERYPRDVPRDLGLCEEAGADIVFTPSVEEVYPHGHATFVEVSGLQDLWEGASRPGHLRGVATVVAVLLRLVGPQRAYFGEKDYQQLQIVRRMVCDLCLDVEIVPCPTVREPDGLAMSSRNAYLGAGARSQAVALWEALRAAQQRLRAGEQRAAALCAAMEDVVRSCEGVELDYATVVDPTTLAPLERVTGEARALIAARVGGVRLIDNLGLVL